MAEANRPPPETNISEIVTGGPTPTQAAKLSEQGLAAVNDAHLARLAINDGYLDSAKKLLAETRSLLDRVKKEDRPVTVTTDVKEGNKPIAHARERERLDLIPILSELQVVEDFAVPGKTPAADKAVPSSDTQKTPAPTQESTEANAARTKMRDTAITQAKERLTQGDRQAAAKALKLADLTLVTREISMPLAATMTHVAQATKLVDEGKPHEANLELKKLQDGLVIDTTIIGESAPDAGMAKAD